MTSAVVKEIDFRRQLVGTKPPGLAVIYGWEHVGFRPAMTKAGWRTPGTGTMAEGWPDLVLLRVRDNRLIFAELKSNAGKLSPDQERVLDVLRSIESSGRGYRELGIALQQVGPKIEVHVWRPRDLEAIAEVLA